MLIVFTINLGSFSTRGSANFKPYMADVCSLDSWDNKLDVVLISGQDVPSVHLKIDTHMGFLAFKLPR